MLRKPSILLFAAALSFTAGQACAQTNLMPGQVESVRDVRSAMAAAKHDLLLLLRDAAFRDDLLTRLLSEPDQRMSIVEMLEFGAGSSQERMMDALPALDRRVRELKGLAVEGDAILQVRLALPTVGMPKSAINASNLYVATPPVGDDRRWLNVVAHTAEGASINFDADGAVPFPTLVIGVNADIAMRDGLTVVNAGLQASGLQMRDLPQGPAGARSNEPLDVSVLSRARLQVDQEPNIKGAAEIFAIVSGLDADEAKLELRTVAMPWLQHDKTTYYPNQDLIIWNGFRYGVANVQLFEEDSQINYKDLLTKLVTGVGAALGPIHPSIPFVAAVGNAILEVLPDSALTDDHDYVDSYYLLERGKAYSNHWGAAHNANVNIVPKQFGR